MGVGIWSTTWGPFLWILEEVIMVAMAAVAAMLTTMTTHEDPVVREKDCASYRALFRDLKGCGSYVRDFGYRTLDGGLLIESVLNLLRRPPR